MLAKNKIDACFWCSNVYVMENNVKLHGFIDEDYYELNLFTNGLWW